MEFDMKSEMEFDLKSEMKSDMKSDIKSDMEFEMKSDMELKKIKIRSLSIKDYSKNYMALLNQLSPTTISKQDYIQFCNLIFFSTNHFVQVVELHNCIVASGTLFIERKLIHNFGKVGHIEDIVVDSQHRHLGIGKQMINHLVKLAEKEGCYKVILNCKDSLVNFYKKCGFQFTNEQMSIYF